ncbi:FecR family protein [Chitinophaga sp. CF118]|uniref:FecR family protein n=1 Tax=Chitinophaga sp. CF118 TaxID=1884367 RepID=UPI0008E497A2|nr:FecR family protein [Chitinophaga sp. CF118]SFD56815.1 FecR family protein [Chitinophaga sp. CF118]
MDKERLSSTALKVVLNKYIQGIATPEEVQQVEQWYATFKEEEIPYHPAEREELRRQIVSGIMEQIPVTHRKTGKWWKVAAAAACITATGFLFMNKDNHKPPVLLAAKEVSTAPGSRKVITLSDGSVIHLNAGTQLTIPGDYGVKERRLILSGEAFFEVATDPRHPFIINTGNVNTTVLGTSFNIRAYKGQEEWQIAVATGKVKVADTVSRQLLSDGLIANKALSYNLATNITTINDLPANITGAWRNNIFYFNNSTLAEIGEELQRQYNISVIVTGKDNGHYKISFSREPLAKVLKVLAGLTGITYTINKDAVIIHKKG